MKKYIISLLTLILMALIYILMNQYISKNQMIEYENNLFYMDTYINIKFWHNNSKEAKKVQSEIEKIYNHYHKISDRYQEYEGITNLYTIYNNQSKEEYLTLDPDLYELLVYGKEWHSKSNGLLNINLGNVIDIWKSYREKEEGIPTAEELQNAGSTNIENIILKEGKIKNNHQNIDLGSIAKGYATQKAGEYLKDQKIEYFLINAGGNVLTGKKYKDQNFKIGIENPNKEGGLMKTIQGSNIAVITSGGYERNYIYNEKLYHHIINPKTNMPENYMKSVTIITDNSTLGDTLSTILFLMPIQEGQEYIKQFSNVEVIWYTNDNQIITTEGINQYE